MMASASYESHHGGQSTQKRHCHSFRRHVLLGAIVFDLIDPCIPFFRKANGRPRQVATEYLVPPSLGPRQLLIVWTHPIKSDNINDDWKDLLLAISPIAPREDFSGMDTANLRVLSPDIGGREPLHDPQCTQCAWRGHSGAWDPGEGNMSNVLRSRHRQ
ncbi:hypothetical protein LY76DRAFT_294891 [Colletotrichum caudatum]|nr:hypothetical protein LY76DRAFT_294891 [Colletotrichum caudatum]